MEANNDSAIAEIAALQAELHEANMQCVAKTEEFGRLSNHAKALQAELAQAQARVGELEQAITEYVADGEGIPNVLAKARREGAAEALERVANTKTTQSINLAGGRLVITWDDLLLEAARLREAPAKPRATALAGEEGK